MTDQYEQAAKARAQPLSAPRVRSSVTGLARRPRERGYVVDVLATVVLAGCCIALAIGVSAAIITINERRAPVSVQSEPFTQVAVVVVESKCVPAARRLRDAIDAPDAGIPREAIEDAWHLIEQCRTKHTLRSAAGLPAPASSAITAFAEYVLATSAGRDGSDASHGHRADGGTTKNQQGASP